MERRNDGRRAQDSRRLALYQDGPGNDRSGDRGRPMNKLGGRKRAIRSISSISSIHRTFHRFTGPHTAPRLPPIRYKDPTYASSPLSIASLSRLSASPLLSMASKAGGSSSSHQENRKSAFRCFFWGVRFLLDSYAQDRMQVPLGESEDKHLCSKHSSLKYVK